MPSVHPYEQSLDCFFLDTPTSLLRNRNPCQKCRRYKVKCIPVRKDSASRLCTACEKRGLKRCPLDLDAPRKTVAIRRKQRVDAAVQTEDAWPTLAGGQASGLVPTFVTESQLPMSQYDHRMQTQSNVITSTAPMYHGTMSTSQSERSHSAISYLPNLAILHDCSLDLSSPTPRYEGGYVEPPPRLHGTVHHLEGAQSVLAAPSSLPSGIPQGDRIGDHLLDEMWSTWWMANAISNGLTTRSEMCSAHYAHPTHGR